MRSHYFVFFILSLFFMVCLRYARTLLFIGMCVCMCVCVCQGRRSGERETRGRRRGVRRSRASLFFFACMLSIPIDSHPHPLFHRFRIVFFSLLCFFFNHHIIQTHTHTHDRHNAHAEERARAHSLADKDQHTRRKRMLETA